MSTHKAPVLLSFLLLVTMLVCVASIETVVVSPANAQGSLTRSISPSKSYSSAVDLLEVASTCQLNFSYVSNDPVSVWVSLEPQAQTLQLLPGGRPCVNQTSCSVSTYLNPNKRHYIIAENLTPSTSTVIFNFSAAASSESGCGIPGPGSVAAVISDYQYVYDDILGPISKAFKGAECISYLAAGFDSFTSNFGAQVDIDGFITTLSAYNDWDDTGFKDGRAVQVPASSCPSDVPYCTATVKGLDPAETYVLALASGYDDTRRQDSRQVQLAFAAGSQGTCDNLDVTNTFTV